MRLIDADALMERLKMHCYIVAYDHGYTSKDYGMTLSGINQVMHELPTIESKKGKWLELDFAEALEYKCDQCGRLSDFEENYCPSCGADMRPEYEEPEINPCRGCADYDGMGGCKSDGGCGADMRGEDHGNQS